jgi:hypothetical protein
MRCKNKWFGTEFNLSDFLANIFVIATVIPNSYFLLFGMYSEWDVPVKLISHMHDKNLKNPNSPIAVSTFRSSEYFHFPFQS